MVANMSVEELRCEIKTLKTSIKYHDWFLGFVVVVGVSLSVFLIGSMNRLNNSVHEMYTKIELIDQKMEGIDQRLQGLERKVEGIDQRLQGLERKVDSYHGRGGNPGL